MANLLGNPQPTPITTPVPPSGEHVGSFLSYRDAQSAIEHLVHEGLAVGDLTVVGVDLLLVERVTGRLTWRKVLMVGVGSGAWLGVLIGLILGLAGHGFLAPLLAGLAMGCLFGLVTAAVPYGATQGLHDFASTSQLVAGHYDLLCVPATADDSRRALDEHFTNHPHPDWSHRSGVEFDHQRTSS